MNLSPDIAPGSVAIACGGTGGHLFPGMAVADELLMRDIPVRLIVSPKEIDQQVVKSLRGVDVITVPAVGLSGGNLLSFVRGLSKSRQKSKSLFAASPPSVVLSMGGFTSYGPAMAARSLGSKIFLHEANSIPGRANRWLARKSDQAFVYFPQTEGLLGARRVLRSGMPVRAGFEALESEPCRMALGLKPSKPVLLVMGGSQGAHAINEVVMEMAPALARRFPDLQFLHLAGMRDAAKVQAFYAGHGVTAVVRGFLTEMELALAAATVAISRAGASSLAEFAATGVPAILIPYPSAANNHQLHNALAFQETGAAQMLAPSSADYLLEMVSELLADEERRAGFKRRVVAWHFPKAASDIAEAILKAMGLEKKKWDGDWDSREMGLAGKCDSKELVPPA